jgi:putative FmdB family regulatory protein
MPTYEYRCAACGQEFEKFQRMSDEPVAECPSCGKQAERRLSGGAGFLFKGSGFYITDYRSESYKKAAGLEGGSASGGESGKKGGATEKADGSSGKAAPEKSSSEKSSSSEGKGSSTPRVD